MDFKVDWPERGNNPRLVSLTGDGSYSKLPSILLLLEAKHRDVVRVERVMAAGPAWTGSIGWTCPRCGRVYAPLVLECPRCNLKGRRETER